MCACAGARTCTGVGRVERVWARGREEPVRRVDSTVCCTLLRLVAPHGVALRPGCGPPCCGLLRLVVACRGLLRLVAACCGLLHLLRLASPCCGLLRLIVACRGLSRLVAASLRPVAACCICCGLLRLASPCCGLLRLVASRAPCCTLLREWAQGVQDLGSDGATHTHTHTHTHAHARTHPRTHPHTHTQAERSCGGTLESPTATLSSVPSLARLQVLPSLFKWYYKLVLQSLVWRTSSFAHSAKDQSKRALVLC